MYSLRQAATMAGMCGHPADSLEYVHTADKLREVIYNKCFDRDKGLYAETPGGKVFSRYTNAMAVLSQAVPPRQVKAVMQSLVTERPAPDEPMRDKFYIFRAMQETGVTGTFRKELESWAQQADSTDMPWHYASAGVANIYLLGITAGIQPASNGFKTVLIAPEPGDLKKIHVAMPHPDGGMISVVLQCNNNKVTGQVQLPFGITGKFRWKGKEMVLHGGPQKVSF